MSDQNATQQSAQPIAGLPRPWRPRQLGACLAAALLGVAGGFWGAPHGSAAAHGWTAFGLAVPAAEPALAARCPEAQARPDAAPAAASSDPRATPVAPRAVAAARTGRPERTDRALPPPEPPPAAAPLAPTLDATAPAPSPSKSADSVGIIDKNPYS